eukprot:TRINITY_DN26291_c0_g1_i2.p1 TRINITY_DN26291_c0_g1~~TRINITY_DN26291_c0_g1_i2.p1  ORF type:complete len:456 (+),score=76.56 TRINITY_DN26291_c0_g1_i2:246-1613(+)
MLTAQVPDLLAPLTATPAAGRSLPNPPFMRLCNQSAAWHEIALLPEVRLLVFAASVGISGSVPVMEAVVWIADGYSMADMDNDHGHALISASADHLLSLLHCVTPNGSSPAVLHSSPELSTFQGSSNAARRVRCELPASTEHNLVLLQYERPTWDDSNPVEPTKLELPLHFCPPPPPASGVHEQGDRVGVCSPPLQSNIPVGRLLEWIEYYLLLGASVVHIPDREAAYREVLLPYVEDRRVVYQEFPSFEPRVRWHYYDQVLANNACVERLRASGMDWVLFADQDEYLQLRGPSVQTLPTWLGSREFDGAWSLSLNTWDYLGPHIYYTKNDLEFLHQNRSYIPAVSQAQRLSHPNLGFREKFLVRAACARFVEVHHAMESCCDGMEILRVDVEEARMNHYGKDEAHPHRVASEVVRDESNTKLSQVLANKVGGYLNKLNAEKMLPDVYSAYAYGI